MSWPLTLLPTNHVLTRLTHIGLALPLPTPPIQTPYQHPPLTRPVNPPYQHHHHPPLDLQVHLAQIPATTPWATMTSNGPASPRSPPPPRAVAVGDVDQCQCEITRWTTACPRCRWTTRRRRMLISKTPRGVATMMGMVREGQNDVMWCDVMMCCDVMRWCDVTMMWWYDDNNPTLKPLSLSLSSPVPFLPPRSSSPPPPRLQCDDDRRRWHTNPSGHSRPPSRNVQPPLPSGSDTPQ